MGQRAEALFYRGCAWGRQGEREKAVADYTTLIEMPDAPAEEKAYALFNRGLVWGDRDEHERAMADWTAVIGMSKTANSVRALALSRRGLVSFQSRGDLGRFTRDVEEAMALDPESVEGEIYGLAELFAGNPAVALESCIQAIRDVDSIQDIAGNILALERHVALLPAASKEAYEKILGALRKRRQELEAGQNA